GTADGYADGLLLGCELGTDEGCRYRDREHQNYLAQEGGKITVRRGGEESWSRGDQRQS
ncbi:hypothetical protein B484DRAFT_325710, partial [Ochromonadaceae sp. CCMP2298]